MYVASAFAEIAAWQLNIAIEEYVQADNEDASLTVDIQIYLIDVPSKLHESNRNYVLHECLGSDIFSTIIFWLTLHVALLDS